MMNRNYDRARQLPSTGRAGSGCRCGRTEIVPECPLTASVPVMAYVPWQNWEGLYSENQALRRGTLFMPLDKPFYGKGGCRRV